jgi:two-component sensor histidine kinase
MMGYALRGKEQYAESIEYMQRSLDLEKKYSYKWKSFIYAAMAGSHSSLGNDSLAIVYFKKIEKDTLYMNLSRSAVFTYTKLGDSYRRVNDLELSQRYYFKALEKTLNLDYKNNLATIYVHIGELFLKKGNRDSTYYYFNKSHEAYKEYGVGFMEDSYLLDSYFKGFIKYYEKDVDSALVLLSKGISEVEELPKITKDDKEAYEKFTILLDFIYEEENDLKSRIELSHKKNIFLNRYYNDLVKEDLQNLEMKYQTKEKEASIAQLEQNKTQQEQIIKQQRIIGFSLGGLLLAFVGFGYLFWRQRKLKDQYEKENLEQRLLRSQMNPHFIGNAMNIVSSLVQKKSSEAIPFINKLSNLFRLILINSREEFVSLDEELETIKGYLDLQTKFVDQLEYQIKVDETIDEEEVIVSPMLIQPLVENAIKHGLMQVEREKLMEINISVDKGSKLLLVEVKDNGIGMVTKSSSQIKKDNSVSGDVIKERLQILKKRFKVNTRINYLNLEQGTKVELYLPYLLDE